MVSYAGGPPGSEEESTTDPPEDGLVEEKAPLVRVVGCEETTSLGLLVVADDVDAEGNPLFVPDERTYLSCLSSAMLDGPGAGTAKGRASN